MPCGVVPDEPQTAAVVEAGIVASRRHDDGEAFDPAVLARALVGLTEAAGRPPSCGSGRPTVTPDSARRSPSR